MRKFIGLKSKRDRYPELLREVKEPEAVEKDEVRCERSEQIIFQRLEINFGKLLLVYFMRPPDLEALSVMRHWGHSPPPRFLSATLQIPMGRRTHLKIAANREERKPIWRFRHNTMRYRARFAKEHSLRLFSRGIKNARK